MECILIDLTDSDHEDSQTPVELRESDDKVTVLVWKRKKTKPTASGPRNLVRDASKALDGQEKPLVAHKLKALSAKVQVPTASQTSHLQAAAESGPNYVGRTAAADPGSVRGVFGRKSNGKTTGGAIHPGAAVHQGHSC